MVTTNGDIASLRRGRLPVRPRGDGRVASSGLDGAWPQSGERVIGNENYRRIVESYPGGRPVSEIQRVVGAEDRWVVTPANTVQQIAGSGDFWWSEWRMTYPDGGTCLCVELIELRDHMVWRETVYGAEPFEAPDWRSSWVSGPDDAT